MQKKVGVRKVGARRTAVGKRERRRLLQLVCCVGLFLVVLLGKGRLPEELLPYLQANTDFRGVFSALGQAIAEGDSVTAAFGALVTGAFAAEPEPSAEVVRTERPALDAAVREMETLPDRDRILARMGITVAAQEPEESTQSESASEEASVDYTGPELPAGATMEYCELGLSDTVTPVSGELTSSYGYRDHPVNGAYTFHSGVDLAAEKGTPVAAFAAGTVDFVGESEAYGLYIQLDHGNGVTTFYCHCSDLCAHKGETVSAGQTIAKVGDTGNATGAHLHMEIKKDGMWLNPLYYVSAQT